MQRSSTYRDFARQSRPGPNYCGRFDSPQRSREVEVGPEEREKKENGCHDLSLDQFPLLPSHKNSMPSEINEPDFKSLQAKECSASLRGIEFGTYKPMPSPLSQPSSVALAEEEYGVSVALDITPPSSKMEILNHEK